MCGKDIADHPSAPCPNGESWHAAAVWHEQQRAKQSRMRKSWIRRERERFKR